MDKEGTAEQPQRVTGDEYEDLRQSPGKTAGQPVHGRGNRTTVVALSVLCALSLASNVVLGVYIKVYCGSACNQPDDQAPPPSSSPPTTQKESHTSQPTSTPLSIHTESHTSKPTAPPLSIQTESHTSQPTSTPLSIHTESHTSKPTAPPLSIQTGIPPQNQQEHPKKNTALDHVWLGLGLCGAMAVLAGLVGIAVLLLRLRRTQEYNIERPSLCYFPGLFCTRTLSLSSLILPDSSVSQSSTSVHKNPFLEMEGTYTGRPNKAPEEV
ncbi:uncharacterized protein LOC136755563 isoform X1 [Amia ocellicauda]|uniref:uncharacterized protein LOC136755563 isoform X1 n=1 Tax=Amia ocellicauda TaxID=2972642 RepID=UPI003463F634